MINSDLIENAKSYKSRIKKNSLAKEPSRKLVIVTCMDSRLDIFKIFDLQDGQAHIIRNAGGVITEDVLRSIAISQRKLNTEELILMQHLDCGLKILDDLEFIDEITSVGGIKPNWIPHGFKDSHENMRQSLELIKNTPYVISSNLAGLLINETTGEVEQVL
jgi:carbonic anhydrase